MRSIRSASPPWLPAAAMRITILGAGAAMTISRITMMTRAAITKGERNDIVLAAAFVAGVTKVFTVGGAQAVAALAYGTESIPQVDKITGPGNAFVAAAKHRVFGVVGIDMVAGPSEILVIADGTTPADWVAMDLFSTTV